MPDATQPTTLPRRCLNCAEVLTEPGADFCRQACEDEWIAAQPSASGEVIRELLVAITVGAR